jgi:hypothetical protein
MAIKQRVCPSCLKPVYTAIRFGNQIKSQLNLIDAVKEQQELILQQLTDEEKYNIINAMNEESMASINNIVGGRWFVCKNQHPYFIGKNDLLMPINKAILTFFLSIYRRLWGCYGSLSMSAM